MYGKRLTFALINIRTPPDTHRTVYSARPVTNGSGRRTGEGAQSQPTGKHIVTYPRGPGASTNTSTPNPIVMAPATPGSVTRSGGRGGGRGGELSWAAVLIHLAGIRVCLAVCECMRHIHTHTHTHTHTLHVRAHTHALRTHTHTHHTHMQHTHNLTGIHMTSERIKDRRRRRRRRRKVYSSQRSELRGGGGKRGGGGNV